MGSGFVGALFAGALITALVYQFLVLPRVHAARVKPPEIATPAAPEVARAADSPGAAPHAAGDLVGRIAAKEKEIAGLQEELDKLRAQNAESEARIAAVEGKPRTWPEGLPSGYRPETLEARFNAVLEKSGLGSLADFDCDEFPCIAVIETKQGGNDWNKKLQTALSEIARSPDLGGRVSMSMTGSERQDGDKLTQMNAVALIPADMFDADLQKRTSNRAQGSLDKVHR